MQPSQPFKYVSYEIAMAAGTPVGQKNFLVNNYLVGRQIWQIDCYYSTDMGNSPISSANVVWTAAQALQACLTLYCYDPMHPDDNAKKGEWIKDIPVATLHRNASSLATNTASYVFAGFKVNGLKIDWNNSYIRFIVPPVLSVGTSALFGVYYS